MGGGESFRGKMNENYCRSLHEVLHHGGLKTYTTRLLNVFFRATK